MKDLKKLKGFNIKTGVKRGWTKEKFCEEYGCTEEELFARLSQIYTVKNSRMEVWNDLLANEKKARKKEEPKEETVIQPEVAEETVNSEEPASESEDCVAVNQSLEELRKSEERQSDKVVELEKQYQAFSSKRYELRKTFQSRQEEMLELKKAYEAKVHEAEEIVQKDNDIVVRMNEIADEYRLERAMLESIRFAIAERSKITIGVHADGEIAPFDEEIVELDESGHEELYAVLREREEAEDFRPKDLRVVARVMKIVARLNVPVEIIFDNEEVELAFEIFRKEE